LVEKNGEEMSFYEHKITVEILIATWANKPPDIKLRDVLKPFEEADCLVGSSSISTQTLGMLEAQEK
jgi:hypothetical protein